MFWFGCWFQEIISPTLQAFFFRTLASNGMITKDIVSSIVTVQEVVNLTDWNDICYNDTKVNLFLEVGKLFLMKNVK